MSSAARLLLANWRESASCTEMRPKSGHKQGNCVPVINTFGGFDNEKCTVSVDRAKKIIR